jgi:hypothetical protein
VRVTRATTPLGAGAAVIYEQFVEGGAGSVDFSGIIRFLRSSASAGRQRGCESGKTRSIKRPRESSP